MEAYIETALDSCIINDMDKLEVLIMNDGSTDKTAEICQKYCDKYPDTFILVNKENGGWGSNLNMAVRMAKGKFFKEMDADDWYDTDNLQSLVTRLNDIDSDLVLTDHIYRYEDRIKENKPEWAEYAGKSFNMDEIKPFHFTIWDACYLTDVLRKNYINLPKHTLYTDTLLVMYQMAKISKATFIKDVVYNYRLDRDGQSMNVESLKKHYKDLVKVVVKSMEFYNKADNKNNKHVKGKFLSTYILFFHYFLWIGNCKEVKKSLMYIDYRLKNEAPELYKETNKAKRVRMLRMSKYLALPLLVKFQKWKDDKEK